MKIGASCSIFLSHPRPNGMLDGKGFIGIPDCNQNFIYLESGGCAEEFILENSIYDKSKSKTLNLIGFYLPSLLSIHSNVSYQSLIFKGRHSLQSTTYIISKMLPHINY